jgi:cyanophycin synthetase
MQIRKLNRLLGPNIWANYPVIEAWVDLGTYEDFPSNTLPGFNDKLMAWLPSMIEHRCGVGERGGFFQRLRGGTWLGHVLEHVTLEIQSLAHMPVGYGRARETSERGVYKVLIEVEDFRFGEACVKVAHDMIMAAAEERDFDLPTALKKLRTLADDYCYGPSTQAIVSAAKARGIPALRLTDGNLVQLGYGKPQRRIWTAETDATSAVAESIAHDKELARTLLSSVGVPIVEGRQVTSPENAWEVAQELGLPVVVKPRNGNKGRGVSIRLEDRTSVEAAFRIAEKEYVAREVVVERFIPGRQYRVLVVGDRAVAASGGQAHQVTGDGVSTVAELVAKANADPQRGDDSQQPLGVLVLDEIALELLRRQGFEPSSVLPDGRAAVLRYNGDLTVDETDRMHADVAAQCVLAVRTIGLDIAGIDLIAEDISRPLSAQGGALIEVNSSPGLIMHLKPLVGSPRPVGEAIVNHLFAKTQSGRVPLVAVSGTNGKTAVASLISDILASVGRTVGHASSLGLTIGERALSTQDGANAESTRRALMNPFVDAIVAEVSEPQVIEEGLAFDHCEVAVITNLGSGDHLGRTFVEELSVVQKAVRAPADIVLPSGYAVLNAGDPGVLEIAEQIKPKFQGKLCYFARAASALPADHLATGGRAVVVDGSDVVSLHGTRRETVLGLAPLTCPVLGLPDFMLDDLLAVVAAGVALGLTPTQIKSGVTRAIGGSDGVALFDAPSGASVLVTPARNAGSLGAWSESLRRIFPERRLTALLEPPADGSRADAARMAAVVLQYFSEVATVVNSGSLPYVEELEAKLGGSNCRSIGRLETMPAALNALLEGRGSGDLLCVCPATGTGYTSALAGLDSKGIGRRRVGGLPSVRHFR